MNIRYLLAGLLLAGLLSAPPDTRGQGIELIGGDVLNGAVNGAVLGGATMAIQSSTSFEPVQFGLGGGIFYGLGMGIYDLTLVSKGEYFYISGTFNDGTNSTILILLDTIYGAAAGTVLGTSWSLLAERPVLEGLRYGSGVGAWAGFGFGILDSFVLAEGPGDFQETGTSEGNTAAGLLSYRASDGRMSLGLLAPELVTLKKLTASGLELRARPGVSLVNFRLNL